MLYKSFSFKLKCHEDYLKYLQLTVRENELQSLPEAVYKIKFVDKLSSSALSVESQFSIV